MNIAADCHINLPTSSVYRIFKSKLNEKPLRMIK